MSDANAVVIALDVGGTFVKAGLVAQSGALVGEPVSFPSESHRDRETVLGRFVDMLRHLQALAAGRPVAGIGVGMPGPFDYTADSVAGLRGQPA